MKNLDKRLGKLVNTLDQITGMLIVASMTDATVREAKEQVINASLELDEIINEILIEEDPINEMD